jgi:hypothetical protein
METRCQKCGLTVGEGLAFCPNCGAVMGMKPATTQVGGGWDMASTVVGQQLPPAPIRAPDERSAHPGRAEASPAQKPAGGGNTVILAIIGFVAVLLIGCLLILLLYINSRG